MDRMLNTRIEKQSIYDIYRACRLCGAGAGYKMPIIQNVVDLDDQEVQLKQKLRECVQIEVHQDDKMPPLICELCVDKVNDFYEFLDMCRQTNIRTRLRLGLPPQSLPRGAPDAGDCILGLTEPVYINSDEDEPLMKKQPPSQKNKLKKEPEVRIKVAKCSLKIEPRTTRLKARREPTPPRVTRLSKSGRNTDNMALSRLQDSTKSSKSTTTSPKSILKKEDKTKSENTSLLTPRLKRPRDSRDNKTDVPNKKVKIAIQRSSSPRGRAPPPPPAPARPAPRRPPSPPAAPPSLPCRICHASAKSAQGLGRHMKSSHTVGYTNSRLACNACGAWFSSGEEALRHHRRHRSGGRPYTCRRCTATFKHQTAYDEHFDKNQCIPDEVVPDEKCERCWREFPTAPLLAAHRCGGRDARPGGKCGKCNKSYALLRSLKRHESSCTARRRGELVVEPELLSRLKPIQVRVARCDPLLANIKQEHFDVSTVASDFGLDRNCVYPYISSVSSVRIKSEPEDFDNMVTIKQEIKEEFCTEEDFVHWDSASETDSEPEVTSVVPNPFAKRKRIDTLSALSLKTIFSRRCLGKVPKKRRRVKTEHAFDSSLGNDVDDVRLDIDSIINNLGNDTTDVLNDTPMDVSNDMSNVVDNDLTDCSNDSAVANDVGNDTGYVNNDSNVLSTDINDSSEVSNDRMDVNGDLTDKNNDITNADSHKNKDDSYLVMDVSNDLTEKALSKESDDVVKHDELKDENVKKDDDKTVDYTKNNDYSMSNSPTVLQSSFNDEQFNNSVKDVLTEMVGSSDTNDVLNEKRNESNEKTDDVCNDSAPVAVDKHSDDENDSKIVSTVDNNFENAINNEDSRESNSLEKNDVSMESIGSKHLPNGSLHDVSNGNNHDATNGTINDQLMMINSSSNLNCNSSTHNNIEQTSVSNNDSLDRKHKCNESDVGIDKTDVINDRAESPVRNENIDSPLHVNNDESSREKDFYAENIASNEDSVSQFDSRENVDATNNDRRQLNSNTNTVIESNNDNTSAVGESLNDNNDSSMKEAKSTEEDDRRLMEELDARIAENVGIDDGNDRCDASNDTRDASNDTRDVGNDKITLEDLIARKDDENSLGLDNISDDEFNFDN